MSIIPLLFRSIILIFLSSASHADEISMARQEGSNLANSLLGKVQTNSKQDVNIKQNGSNSVGEIINFKGTNLAEVQYNERNMADAANKKVSDKNYVERQVVSNSFLRSKEYPISYKDGLFDKARDAHKHPEDYASWLSGKYTDCKTEGGEAVSVKALQVCDEYKAINEKACVVGRKLVVDQKHNYQCARKLNKFEKVCSKELKIDFINEGEGDQGNLRFVSADHGPLPGGSPWNTITWNYNYPFVSINFVDLDFGLREGDFEYSYLYKRGIRFDVVDKSSFKTFKLIGSGAAGSLTITLNGHLLHRYPGVDVRFYTYDTYGMGRGSGTKHYEAKVNGVVMTLRAFIEKYDYERIYKNGQYPTLDIDLLPYLNNGRNELVLRGVAIKGSIRIEAKQQRIKEQETWHEVCKENTL